MPVLSAQSIQRTGVISPCLPASKDHRNCSKGLSACGYDLSLAEPIVVTSFPSSVITMFFGGLLLTFQVIAFSHANGPDVPMWWRAMLIVPALYFMFAGWYGTRHASRLVGAAEYFNLPGNIMARICDKSSLARRHCYVLNTVAEPGWRGYMTIEITNMGLRTMRFEEGDAIAQAIFEWLDESTFIPYSGKYQDQAVGAQEAK